MPTVYIHFGAPKTGTSYLQVLFAKYADELLRHGIMYPTNRFVDGAKDGRITSGNGVVMANYLRPGLPHAIDDKDNFINEFNELLENSGGNSMLFSSEFIVFPNNERSAALRETISRNKYDVKLIYLVRDFFDAARSTYSQQVKRAGEARKFSEFLLSWDPYYLHHCNLARDVFGDEALNIYNYEEHKRDLSHLVFGEFLRCPIKVDLKQTINRSLEGKELELLRLFNEISGGNNSEASTFVSDALIKLPADKQGRNLPTKEEYERLATRFATAIERLNAKIIGQKLKISSGYREEADEIELNVFERFTMSVLSQLVVQKGRL